jgi:hypothetical protein
VAGSEWANNARGLRCKFVAIRSCGLKPYHTTISTRAVKLGTL